MTNKAHADSSSFEKFFQELKKNPHSYQKSLEAYKSEVSVISPTFTRTPWVMNIVGLLDFLKSPETPDSPFWSSLKTSKVTPTHYRLRARNPYSTWMNLTYNFHFYEGSWRLFTPITLKKINEGLNNDDFYYILFLQASRSSRGGSLTVTINTNALIDVLGNKPFGYTLPPNPKKIESKSYSVFNILAFPKNEKKQIQIKVTKNDSDEARLGFVVLKVKKANFQNNQDELLEKGHILKDTSLLSNDGVVEMSNLFGYKQIKITKPLNKEYNIEF
jgi:hypothetical protein